MRHEDLKNLMYGVGMAAFVGLLTGGAMKPTLDIDERPEGPQMFAGWSGARSTGPFDDGATFAGYQGQIPDYVVGTDWKKQIAWQDEAPVEAAPSVEDSAQPAAAQVKLTPAVFSEPKAEPAAFPSMAGGASYHAETPAPPPAPVVAAKPTFDVDVPPEATGDTTVVATTG
jgi:hypothetical protein